MTAYAYQDRGDAECANPECTAPLPRHRHATRWGT